MKPSVPFVLFVLSVPFISFSSVLTDSWSVDVRQHAAVDRVYSRGESWDMRVSFRQGFEPLDLTGATAGFYWYTNTTANLWWPATATVYSASSGIVSAVWTPDMDVGATNYPYWIGLWLPGSTNPIWRASGTIKLLGSPGTVVNRRDAPTVWFDWSAIRSTNAPWATAAQLQAASNALATSVQAAARAGSNYTDAAVAPLATTQQVAAALAALATNRVTTTWDTNGHWYVDSGNGTRTEYWTNCVAGGSVSYSADFYSPDYLPAFTNVFFSGEDLNLGNYYVIGRNGGNTVMNNVQLGSTWVGNGQTFDMTLEPLYGWTEGTVIISPAYQTRTNSVTYFCSTNAVVPETWSYSDHTNWMEVAGTNWVVQMVLDPWWYYRRADLISSEEYAADWVIFLNSEMTPDPLPQYLLKAAAFNSTNATLVNPTVVGKISISNSQPTNLVLRLSASNDYIIVEEVLP